MSPNVRPLLGASLLSLLVPPMSGCTFSIDLGLPAGGGIFGSLLGLGVWLLANHTYLEYRRKAEPSGLKRFLVFWLGWPATLLTRVVVPEGVRYLEEDDDYLDELPPGGDPHPIEHD